MGKRQPVPSRFLPWRAGHAGCSGACSCVTDGSTCTMSEWITWSPCSISCGMGMRSRERYVKQFPEDGSVCTLPTEETEKCTVNEECCE